MSTVTQTLQVLLVEDEPADAHLALDGLKATGCVEARLARSCREALEAVHEGHFDIAVVDHRLPDGTGVDLQDRMRAAGFTGRFVLLTGVRQENLVDDAFLHGADDFVVKDLDYGDRLADAVLGLAGY